MKLNKIITAFGAALLALTSLSPLAVSADQLQSAEDVLQDGSFEYESVNGGYKITKCTATMITEIPAIRNGVPIIEIGERAFAGFTGISELVLPDSITTIGENAFYGCSNAQTLVLPKKLKSLGEGAFAGCSGITELKIPDSLTEIPVSAFAKCDHLTTLDLGNGVTKIDSNAFYECTSLSKLTLPPSLTEIGSSAFGELLSLTEIDASKNDSFTFKDDILTDKSGKDIYCALSTIKGTYYVPDGTVTIKGGAFSAAAGIEELHVPASVEEIGEGAFSCLFTGEMGYCSLLKNLDLENGLETIGDHAFAYTSIERLSLPVTVDEIGNGAFMGNYALTNVILPEGIKSIGENAFYNCDKLRTVAVPKSVKSIGDHAFGFVKSGDEPYEKLDGFKMSVFSRSEGKKYAKANSLEYNVKDRSLLKMAFIVVCVGIGLAAIVYSCVLMSRSRKRASASVRKAIKEEKEKAEEASYKKIIDGDDSDTDKTDNTEETEGSSED